jgi:hypothetical protein
MNREDFAVFTVRPRPGGGGEGAVKRAQRFPQ